MSSIPQIGVGGDLFHKGGGVFGSFEYDQKESRSSYDIGSKKKRPAPQPPKGLSQYKPKILTSDIPGGGVPVNHNGGTPIPPPRPSKARDRGIGNNDLGDTKPIIMGDKDVPMVIHSHQDSHDPDLDVSTLNLTSHDALDQGHDIGTDNPLFSMHNGSTIAAQHEENIHLDDTDNTTKNKEPDGVYIPVPDYEEEEVTMTMSEELEDDDTNNSSPQTKVYKEYDGEDFGQYLSDEEGGPTGIYRYKQMPTRPMNPKPKTEVKRTVKHKKNKSGFTSLRDFSYADSKYGTTKGHKNLHSLSSGPTHGKEADDFINREATYEQFLRDKNGTGLGQMGSSQTYRREETGEGAGYVDQVHNNKDSLWKRLTWKVKKQGNSFDLAASS